MAGEVIKCLFQLQFWLPTFMKTRSLTLNYYCAALLIKSVQNSFRNLLEIHHILLLYSSALSSLTQGLVLKNTTLFYLKLNNARCFKSDRDHDFFHKLAALLDRIRVFLSLIEKLVNNYYIYSFY